MSCSFVGGYLGFIFDIIFGTLFGVIFGIILAALSGVIFGTFFGYPKGGFINQGRGLITSSGALVKCILTEISRGIRF